MPTLPVVETNHPYKSCRSPRQFILFTIIVEPTTKFILPVLTASILAVIEEPLLTVPTQLIP